MHGRRAAACAATGVLAAALVAAEAFGHAQAPRASLPAAVHPGRMVVVKVAGFPAGERVQLQFGLWHDPPYNCCVSSVTPRRHADGWLIPDTGSRTLRVRMPRRYAQCVSYQCKDRGWKRFRRGDQVYVWVTTDFTASVGNTYASGLSRVR
jgi:hypothetical protein